MPPSSEPVGIAFDGKNPEARAQAAAYAARMVTNVSDETRDGLRVLVERSISEGIPPAQAARLIRDMVGLTAPHASAVMNYRYELYRQNLLTPDRIDREVRKYADKLIRHRSLNIARTEVMGALNRGRYEAWQQAVNDGTLGANADKRWSATPDEKTCEICDALHGETVPLGGAFTGGLLMPPAHPSCVTGETRVLACGALIATSRRWYDGDIFVIRTAAGYELSCTPNHPILTDRGWVSARGLHVGEDVVCHVPVERVPSAVDFNHEDVPPSIEQVVRSLSELREARTTVVPVSAEDFHGDGGGSEVAVVTTNRLLRDGIESALEEQTPQQPLTGAGLRPPLVGDRAADELPLGALDAAHRVMRGLRLSLPFAEGHPLPLEGFGFALVAEAYAARKQYASDFGPVREATRLALERARESVLRLPGQVAFDEIVSIEVRPFQGHVFNLQTSSEVYIANSIVTHNCRCSAVLVPRPVEHDAPATVEDGPAAPATADELAEQAEELLAEADELLEETEAGLIEPITEQITTDGLDPELAAAQAGPPATVAPDLASAALLALLLERMTASEVATPAELEAAAETASSAFEAADAEFPSWDDVPGDPAALLAAAETVSPDATLSPAAFYAEAVALDELGLELSPEAAALLELIRSGLEDTR